jgi:hypothetical protein
VPEHIGDNSRIELAQLRQLLRNKCAHSDVLQADRIDHPAGRLAYPRCRRSGHRLRGQSLHNDPAKPIQIHEFGEFDSITECAARRDDWIF